MEYKNPTIGPGFTRSFHQIRETYDQSTASVRHRHYSHITQILLTFAHNETNDAQYGRYS